MPRKLTKDEIVEKLVSCLHLYPNYPVASRGPAGLLMDIIQDLRPDVAEAIREEDAAVAYDKFFGDQHESI